MRGHDVAKPSRFSWGHNAWPGRRCRTRPEQLALIKRDRSRLAPRLAPTPGKAPSTAAAADPTNAASASATATSAATTAAATTAASATAASTAAAASTGELDITFFRRSRAFLVEDVERGQTHIGDFFFAQSDLLIGRIIRRLGCVIRWRNRSRRAAHHRKGQASRTQSGERRLHSLRRLLHSWHIRILHFLASGSSAMSLLQGLPPRKLKRLHELPKARRFHIDERCLQHHPFILHSSFRASGENRCRRLKF